MRDVVEVVINLPSLYGVLPSITTTTYTIVVIINFKVTSIVIVVGINSVLLLDRGIAQPECQVLLLLLLLWSHHIALSLLGGNIQQSEPLASATLQDLVRVLDQLVHLVRQLHNLALLECKHLLPLLQSCSDVCREELWLQCVDDLWRRGDQRIVVAVDDTYIEHELSIEGSPL